MYDIIIKYKNCYTVKTIDDIDNIIKKIANENKLSLEQTKEII